MKSVKSFAGHPVVERESGCLIHFGNGEKKTGESTLSTLFSKGSPVWVWWSG